MKTINYFNALISCFKNKSSINNFASGLLIPLTLLTVAALTTNLAFAQHANNNKSSLGDIINNSNVTLLVQSDATGIPNASVTLTPYELDGDSIPNPYSGQTDEYGLLDLTVLHSAFLGVGLPEIQEEKLLNTPLNVYDLNGRLVTTTIATGVENNTLSYQVDLPSLANAMYVLRAEIDGNFYTEKFVSINDSYQGKLSLKNNNFSNNNNNNNNFNKSSTATLEDAVYELDVTAPDHIPYHANVSFVVGDNSWTIVNMQEEEGLPQHQDLTGRVLHQIGQSVTTYPFSTVYVTNSSTGAVTSIETDENANWIFPNAPLNTTFLVSYEGTGSEWSPEDVAYTTPVYNENTWSANDTIHSGLTGIIVQPDDGTTVEHLAQQGGHGTNQDTIEYYLIPNSFTTPEEENVHNYFLDLTADENQAYIFTESTEPLNGIGITLSHGTNNTIADPDDISTSWNHHLYPIKSATTTTTADSYIVFVHEVKRALGFDGVAWGPDYDESVMETPVENYSPEDISISKLVSTYYYDAYRNNTHGVPLSYLTPGVSKRTKEKAIPLQIQVDNINYHFE